MSLHFVSADRPSMYVASEVKLSLESTMRADTQTLLRSVPPELIIDTLEIEEVSIFLRITQYRIFQNVKLVCCPRSGIQV